jgi:hypothetical protein
VNESRLSDEKNPTKDEHPVFIQASTENHGGSNPTPGAKTSCLEMRERFTLNLLSRTGQ